MLKISLAATRNSNQIPVQIGSSRDVAFPEIFFFSQHAEIIFKKGASPMKIFYPVQISVCVSGVLHLRSHSTLLCHQTSNPPCIRPCAETFYLQISISVDKFTKGTVTFTSLKTDAT